MFRLLPQLLAPPRTGIGLPSLSKSGSCGLSTIPIPVAWSRSRCRPRVTRLIFQLWFGVGVRLTRCSRGNRMVTLGFPAWVNPLFRWRQAYFFRACPVTTLMLILPVRLKLTRVSSSARHPRATWFPRSWVICAKFVDVHLPPVRQTSGLPPWNSRALSSCSGRPSEAEPGDWYRCGRSSLLPQR